MRRFHSYGPVDARHHFCVERKEIVDQCVNQLIGIPDERGHYFTIWAARQTGKTWLIYQAMQEIPKHYGDAFAVQLTSLAELDELVYVTPPVSPDMEKVKMPGILRSILERDLPGKPHVQFWNDVPALFSRQGGLWDRPVILFIDEVDTAPSWVLDLLVRRLRELYLHRSNNWLHGLALVGVRAVVGIESKRGSPFNIQRSLQVPKLTADEVREMYRQYQDESGQPIAPEVVETVYKETRGQPGLVSWFGELLTETYNPGHEYPIDMPVWYKVWNGARFLSINNNVLNLITKAREEEYQPFLAELFNKSEILFKFYDPLHNYLYMHGIVEPDVIQESPERHHTLCRFTSPFIQHCLYDTLSDELVYQNPSVLPLHPLDKLKDVFDPPVLNLPALLQRYKDYLARLKAKGINPWKEQPRRQTDHKLTEAVGHFHLYWWLYQTIGKRTIISPEFPTGNGKVDVHIKCGDKRGLIEVKSFVDDYTLDRDKSKAANYAKQVLLDRVTMAVFIPVLDEGVLEQLSTTETHDGVEVTVVMIGWF